MKKFLLLLFAVASMEQAAWAQGFDYDIWFDSRRDAMTHGKFMPGDNELTLDLSVVTSAGLHFLNVIPYYEWGEMGQWRCIPFIVPEGWPHTSNAKWVEYWVTAYDSQPKRLEYTGTEMTLDIDISQMSYGLHFFNFRTFNEVGEAGPWKQIMFYISNGIHDADVMNYEYWVDDREHIAAEGQFPSVLPIDIDMNELTPGTHTFYFKAKNWFGGEGEQFSVQFEVKPPVTVTANSYSREYGEENPVFEFTSEGATLEGEPVITCEADKLSPAGEYPIVITKGSVANYDDTYVNGTLTITKAPLTVKAEDAVREEGEENPTFTLTYSGWKNGETENVLTVKPIATTDATQSSPAGTYVISVSGGEAQNYELSYENGTLTIMQSTGIGVISIDSNEVEWFTLDGQRVETPTEGAYIIRLNNGSVRKVLVK